jgi:hypothetical protein
VLLLLARALFVLSRMKIGPARATPVALILSVCSRRVMAQCRGHNFVDCVNTFGLLS